MDRFSTILFLSLYICFSGTNPRTELSGYITASFPTIVPGFSTELHPISARSPSIAENFLSPVSMTPFFGEGIAAFIFQYFIMLNIMLALFNMLPIPPLDGSHILRGILPAKHDKFFFILNQYGFFILIALLMIPRVFTPLYILFGWIYQLLVLVPQEIFGVNLMVMYQL